MVYPALLPLMRTPRLPVVDPTDAPTDLNGLVRFAERRNLVSARVPSHFNCPLPEIIRAPGIAFPGTLDPTGIRSPDHRARSESLYQLSYSGPHREQCIILKCGAYIGIRVCVVFYGIILTRVLWPLKAR